MVVLGQDGVRGEIGSLDPRGQRPQPWAESAVSDLEGVEGCSPRVCVVCQGRLYHQPHGHFTLVAPLLAVSEGTVSS